MKGESEARTDVGGTACEAHLEQTLGQEGARSGWKSAASTPGQQRCVISHHALDVCKSSRHNELFFI